MYAAWVGPFLESLRRQGVVAVACRAAGISYTTAYALRANDADFAAAWDDALEESYDALEAELLDRAVNGVAEPIVYQGAFTYEYERDEQGRVVMETYDTGVKKDGEPVMGTRPKPLVVDGRPVVATVRKKSDALLMFALKGRRKKVYAERAEVTGADGGPVQVDEGTRTARIAQLIALAKARKLFGDIA